MLGRVRTSCISEASPNRCFNQIDEICRGSSNFNLLHMPLQFALASAVVFAQTLCVCKHRTLSTLAFSNRAQRRVCLPTGLLLLSQLPNSGGTSTLTATAL